MDNLDVSLSHRGKISSQAKRGKIKFSGNKEIKNQMSIHLSQSKDVQDKIKQRTTNDYKNLTPNTYIIN